MKVTFLILSLISLLAGISILTSAQSAIHEIESFILFTIFAILISEYGIMHQIDKLGEKILNLNKGDDR